LSNHYQGVGLTPEQAKELIRHIMEDGFNQQNISVVEASFTEDYVRHGYGGPSANSLAEHIESLKKYHSALTDARFEIQQMVSDGESVAVRYILRGVHTGTFMGVEPSGNEVERHAVAIFTIRNNKVVEGHIVSDSGGLLDQLQNK
jgi:predicted ester cyclase|tara:strand:- start:520 stop:957 length:438 start_codon:yes stop_codon:yes gene_type:complete